MLNNHFADQLWRSMASMVIDNRDAWKRSVIDTTGLPYSRIRVLRKLATRPMTAKQVAEAATMDAPAATHAVNDLEERGLVVRVPDPVSRRSKVISLTDDGRRMVARVEQVDDPAPPSFAALGQSELDALAGILVKLTDFEPRGA